MRNFDVYGIAADKDIDRGKNIERKKISMDKCRRMKANVDYMSAYNIYETELRLCLLWITKPKRLF
jgi:hypothetical protein